ncbi:MAG: hypothetical protein V1487_01830 [bacterium]
MQSARSGVSVKVAKKSRLIWVVLACVVLGVGLGIVVYQQSVQPVKKTAVAPKSSVRAIIPSSVASMMPSPMASASALPRAPQVNVIDEPDYGDYEYEDEDWTPSSPSPSPSRSTLALASASARASSSSTASTRASASPSARTVMPDTTEGVPTTGVFEVTVGTVSVGLIFLVLGLVGLLVL